MARRLGLALVLLLSIAITGPACDKNQTVTAPALTASCAATPASGPAPLAVAFTLSVAGAEGTFSVAIDYGDGTQGSEPDRTHVYGAAGAYTPSFTVTTATQSARCSTLVSVSGAGPTPTPPPTGGNQPPEAVYHTTPGASGSTISGTAPLAVAFNLCRSEDPEKDALRFRMDLDGDGVFELEGSTGGDCRKDTSYGAGTHHATICVTDIDCGTWPSCGYAPTLHPFQCRTYTVLVTP